MAFFIKITINAFDNASRDKREISVVQELGHQIAVVAKGDQRKTVIDKSGKYPIHRLSSRPLGKSQLLTPINRIFSVFLWAHYVRKLHPDCISCHNIMALFIGWIATWFIAKSKRAKLVYDAHEYTLGINEKKKRSKLYMWLLPKFEKAMLEKCAFSIMVNDSIADAVQEVYKLKERPVVVRNIAPYWIINEETCRARRTAFCNTLGVPESTFFVMYHGSVMSGRGIENLLNAAQKAGEDVAVIVLGYGDTMYIESLRSRAKSIGLHLILHKAVPVDLLWEYVGAVDAGVSLAMNTCINHYYMLPNKIFENIQSLTPLIVSDFPEIKRIVEGYGVGLCCDPANVAEISETITRIKTDKELYAHLKSNLKAAKKELCWEKEKNYLIKAYSKILGDVKI